MIIKVLLSKALALPARDEKLEEQITDKKNKKNKGKRKSKTKHIPSCEYSHIHYKQLFYNGKQKKAYFYKAAQPILKISSVVHKALALPLFEICYRRTDERTKSFLERGGPHKICITSIGFN